MTLLQRCQRRFNELWPVLLGSVAFLVVLSLLAWATEPWWPEVLHQLRAQVDQRNWAEALRQLKTTFATYGDWQPWLFMGLQTLQVLLAPIPGQLMGMLGGMLFGFWGGLGLTMVGLAVGSAVAIGLGRLVGVWLVRRVVPPAVMLHFEYLIEQGGLMNFFLLFLLPALPDDAICFMAGLTRHRLGALIGVCLLGRLPGMAVLTWVGSSLGEDALTVQVILVSITLAAVAVWFFQEEVRGLFHRWSKSRT